VQTPLVAGAEHFKLTHPLLEHMLDNVQAEPSAAGVTHVARAPDVDAGPNTWPDGHAANQILMEEVVISILIAPFVAS
jgi:hypothetical protein